MQYVNASYFCEMLCATLLQGIDIVSSYFDFASSLILHFIQGAFTDQHFDQDLNFHATEEDPVTKKV